QMGVDVRPIERPFDAPVMSRLTSPSVATPPGAIWGERKPGYYLVEARGNAGALVVNRLLAANVKASWLDAPVDVNGFHYLPGSLLVPSTGDLLKTLQDIVRPLGLRVDGVRGK